MKDHNPIKKVVVVGRDADAWLSAMALQIAFAKKNADLEVCLVELPSLLTASDYYVTLPTQAALHQLLGIDQAKLLSSCEGLQFLGQRFYGWSGNENSFLHVYDTYGASIKGIDFYQYWLKARRSGLNVPLEDFSLAAAAAKQGRFFVFNDMTESFSNAAQGFHLHALSYLSIMASVALQAGVKHYPTDSVQVEIGEGVITAVTLSDGQRIDGDLFVDASGSDAVLANELDPKGFDSWSQWFPCDRVITASGPALRPTPAYSQNSAFEYGWIGLYPLVNSTAITAVYSSEYSDSERVLTKIYELTGVKPSMPVESVQRTGFRPQSWAGNCVCLGSSAVDLEPLDATSLLMLHNGISHLIAMFPVSNTYMPEADLFNQKMQERAQNVRDFQLSHYALNKRIGQSFWDCVRHQDIPESLKNKISLFESHGIVPMNEEETFQEENWTSIFTGHGLIPNVYASLVDRMADQDQIEHFQNILKFIAKQVDEMPTLQAHIELNSGGASSESSF